MTDFAKQKQIVVESCVRLADQGYLAGTGGNVGLRLDSDHFAVTPSGADYYSMRADDICVLRLDDLTQIEGDKPASVERAMHACLMRADPSRHATIHTHQPIASAVALLHADIPVPKASQEGLGACVAVVRYGPSGTSMLVRALAKRLRPDLHGYLLASHGVVCRAPSMEQAIALVSRIEKAAASFLEARIARQAGLDNAIRTLALGALHPILQQDTPR